MEFETLTLLLVIGAMVVIFVTSLFPADLTALSGLMLLTLLGLIPTNEAFHGFSSPAVITLIATFFLGAAMRSTGVASLVATRLYRYTGESEVRSITAIMILAALLSAFMTNVAAVAVMLPAAMSLAQRSGISPSKLLIPMSFAAVLGGTMTLVGNTANILTASIMQEKGLQPFGFFSFTPFGAGMLLFGLLLLVLWGRRRLPARVRIDRKRTIDLTALYKLNERMLSLEVPAHSRLVGQTLESARLGQVLDATVLAILRQDQRILAPAPGTKILARDTLIVRSRLDQLEKLLQFNGVQVSELNPQQAGDLVSTLSAAGLKLVDKAISAWNLKDLDFRNRFGLIVCAIERQGTFILSRLNSEPLQPGDVIHVIGKAPQISETASGPYFTQVESEVSVEEFLQAHLCMLNISSSSELIGKTLQSSQIGELAGVTVVGIIRGSSDIIEARSDTIIEASDNLIVAGERAYIERLAMLSELHIGPAHADPALESKQVALLEVVLSPRSSLFGQSLREISFREKYGFQVVALWRQGKPVRSQLAVTPLQFGDALLLQGPRDKIPMLLRGGDFVSLSEDLAQPEQHSKAIFAILGLLVMIGLSVSGLQPVHIAAFAGALIAVLSGALPISEAYREVEWKVIFLVACLIPLGGAVESLGIADMISGWFFHSAGQFGPFACIIACSLLASLLSQMLDSSVTVILLAPVALSLAQQLGLSPDAFLMVISISTSIAFLTPFSHKAHLLVMGPGAYEVKDYLRVGWLLSIVCFLALWGLIESWYDF